jgi:hypothetical protein
MFQRRRKFSPKSAKKLAISGSSQHFLPFLLSPPCLQPLKPPQTPFSSTNRWQRSLPTNLNPHQWQIAHWSSPPADFLLLLSSYCNHRQPPPSPPLAPRYDSHKPDHCHARCTLYLSFPFFFFFFFFLLFLLFAVSIH